jgi:hypothetical protein
MHCDLCFATPSYERAEAHGVLIPDGRLFAVLCDDCDDDLRAYWDAVDRGEHPPLFGEVV